MKNSFKLLAFTLIITLATCSNGMSRLFHLAPATPAAINNNRLFSHSAFTHAHNSIKASNLVKKFATSSQSRAFGMPAQHTLMDNIGTENLAATAVNTTSSEQVATKKEPLTQNEISILTAAADLRIIDTEIAALKRAIQRELDHKHRTEDERARACDKLKKKGISEDIQTAIWRHFEYAHDLHYERKLWDELHSKEAQKKAYLLTLNPEIAIKAEQLNNEYFKALHLLPQEKKFLNYLYDQLKFTNQMNGLRTAVAKVDQHFGEMPKAIDNKAHQEDQDELSSQIQAQLLKIQELEAQLKLQYKA